MTIAGVVGATLPAEQDVQIGFKPEDVAAYETLSKTRTVRIEAASQRPSLATRRLWADRRERSANDARPASQPWRETRTSAPS